MRRRTYFYGLVISLSLSLSLVLPPSIAKADTVFTIDSKQYIHNGDPISMDITPKIVNDRTMVPVRYLAESCGASVAWDEKSKLVTLNKDQTIIQLTIGSKKELVNKKVVEMDVAPVIINNRTMLPARWVAENFGWQLSWNDTGRTVTIFPKQISTIDNFINVRQSPDEQGKILGVLPHNTIIAVDKDFNNWYQISLADGSIGWIAGWLTIDSSEKPLTNISLLKPASTSTDVSRGNNPAPQELFDGLGIWTSIYTKLPNDQNIAQFSKADINRIYLQVATSYRGFPSEWQEWIDTLLPAAHRAGIKVIGWAYTDLKNPVSDAQLIAQVSNYRTPSGDYLDGVAADIEQLPSDVTQAQAIIEQFSNEARSDLRSECPLIAITYPPQQRPKYPFYTMTEKFDAVVLMDYWHTKNRVYEEPEVIQFINQSVVTLKQAGCKVPIEVALQGCDIGAGMITPAEMQAAVKGADSAGVGYSIYSYITDIKIWEAFVSNK